MSAVIWILLCLFILNESSSAPPTTSYPAQPWPAIFFAMPYPMASYPSITPLTPNIAVSHKNKEFNAKHEQNNSKNNFEEKLEAKLPQIDQSIKVEGKSKQNPSRNNFERNLVAKLRTTDPNNNEQGASIKNEQIPLRKEAEGLLTNAYFISNTDIATKSIETNKDNERNYKSDAKIYAKAGDTVSNKSNKVNNISIEQITPRKYLNTNQEEYYKNFYKEHKLYGLNKMKTDNLRSSQEKGKKENNINEKGKLDTSGEKDMENIFSQEQGKSEIEEIYQEGFPSIENIFAGSIEEVINEANNDEWLEITPVKANIQNKVTSSAKNVVKGDVKEKTMTKHTLAKNQQIVENDFSTYSKGTVKDFSGNTESPMKSIQENKSFLSNLGSLFKATSPDYSKLIQHRYGNLVQKSQNQVIAAKTNQNITRDKESVKKEDNSDEPLETEINKLAVTEKLKNVTNACINDCKNNITIELHAQQYTDDDLHGKLDDNFGEVVSVEEITSFDDDERDSIKKVEYRKSDYNNTNIMAILFPTHEIESLKRLDTNSTNKEELQVEGKRFKDDFIASNDKKRNSKEIVVADSNRKTPETKHPAYSKMIPYPSLAEILQKLHGFTALNKKEDSTKTKTKQNMPEITFSSFIPIFKPKRTQSRQENTIKDIHSVDNDDIDADVKAFKIPNRPTPQNSPTARPSNIPLNAPLQLIQTNPRNKAMTMPQTLVQNIPIKQNIPQIIQNNAPQHIPQQTPQITPYTIPYKAQHTTIQTIPQNTLKSNTPQQIQPNIPYVMPQNVKLNTPQFFCNNNYIITQTTRENLHQIIPYYVQQNAQQHIPQKIEHNTPIATELTMSKSIPQDIQNLIIQLIQDDNFNPAQTHIITNKPMVPENTRPLQEKNVNIQEILNCKSEFNCETMNNIHNNPQYHTQIVNSSEGKKLIIFKPEEVSLLKVYEDFLEKLTMTVLVPFHVAKLVET